jgi:hypothetical protein
MFKPKVILPDDSYMLGMLGEYAGSGSLKGKPVIVRDTLGIVPDFVIERGYRSENDLSVRMMLAE